MRNPLAVVLLLLIHTLVFGQDEDFVYPQAGDYPTIASRGQNIEDFVPEGFRIEASAKGDLNGDKTPDAAILLRGAFEKFRNKNDGLGTEIYDTNPRVLAILLKNKASGNYEFFERSNSFVPIPVSPTMSEPFEGMSITRGVLRIDMEQWYSAGTYSAAKATFRFRIVKGEMSLIGADRMDYSRAGGDTEERSYNFLTGLVKITKGNFANDRKPVVRTRKIGRRSLKTFKTFPKAFEWEIEPDYYL